MDIKNVLKNDSYMIQSDKTVRSTSNFLLRRPCTKNLSYNLLSAYTTLDPTPRFWIRSGQILCRQPQSTAPTFMYLRQGLWILGAANPTDSFDFSIKDFKIHRVLILRTNHHELYTNKNPQLIVSLAQRYKSTDEYTWHHRLRHPNSWILQYLQSNHLILFNKLNSYLCTSCQISKSAMLYFSLSDARSYFLLKKYIVIYGVLL